MTPPTVLIDACVLYSQTQRDVLMNLAEVELFHAKWTESIHREWMDSLLRNHPELDRAKIERTRDLMNLHVPNALVSGYESLIDDLILPDPDDRHVLAAAIFANANSILTHNLKDFPRATLNPYRIEADHPDSFLLGQLLLSTDLVLERLCHLRRNLRKPAFQPIAFLEMLSRNGLPLFAAELQPHADRL